MVENLKRFLTYQSYSKMNTNLEHITVYFREEEQMVQVVVLNDLVSGMEITKDQYAHILEQIEQVFLKKGYGQVSILSLLCTKNIERIREFCEQNQFTHWIVDLNEQRLVIYENQPSTFYNLRDQLESILIGKVHAINPEYEKTSNPIRKEKRMNKQELKWRLRDKPVVTVAIIAINVLIFLLVEVTGSSESTYHLLNWGAASYEGIVEQHQVYRLFTAMFLHAGFDHLFNNMLVLFIVGERLERIIGGARYLFLYIGTGLAASVGSLIYYAMQYEDPVCVGASGAIFGVVGGVAFLVFRYRGRGLDITPARLMLFVAISLYGGFTSEGVDNAAHVVGFISGIVIMMLIDGIQTRKRRKW